MNLSPNLRREIKKINTNNNDVEVIFHNGSSFVVQPCNDDARGARSTILIVDFKQSLYTVMYIEKVSEFGSENREIIMSKEV